MPIPDAKEYEGFPQIENGVGLVAALQEEFELGISKLKPIRIKKTVSIITGELVYSIINSLAKKLMSKCDGLMINTYSIKNEFFGGGVNVSGLVVGQDIKNQLQGKDLGEELFFSSSMLRAGEDVFLDDTTLTELEEFLGVKMTPVNSDGFEFIEKITGEELDFS